MKKILLIATKIFLLLTLLSFFFHSWLTIFWLFLFWLASFLLLLTESQEKIFYFINLPLFALFTLLRTKNIFLTIIFTIIFGLFLFLRAKIYQKSSEKELKVSVFARARSDFQTFFRFILLLALFVFISLSYLQKENFHKILTKTFDVIDKITTNFQIGLSSKTTIADLLKKEMQILEIPETFTPDIYQSALEMLNQKFGLELKTETTLRELILQNIVKSPVGSIIFLVFFALIIFYLFSLSFWLIALPSALIAQALVAFLIKLNLIKKISQKVDKEKLILQNG